MNPDDILNLLEELGSRLEPPARQAFEYAVRWEFTNSLIIVIAAILFVIGLSLGAIFLYKKTEEANSNPHDIVAYKIGVVMLYLVLLLFPAFILVTSLSNLLNPEWAVLQKILPIN